MKHRIVYAALALLALAAPVAGQEGKNRQPFDHHNLPDGPDPFTTLANPGIPPTGQVLGGCVEPAPPLSDPASLQLLGVSLSVEFERYFSEAQKYLMCLDQIKFDYVEVMRRHGEEYRSLLQR